MNNYFEDTNRVCRCGRVDCVGCDDIFDIFDFPVEEMEKEAEASAIMDMHEQGLNPF